MKKATPFLFLLLTSGKENATSLMSCACNGHPMPSSALTNLTRHPLALDSMSDLYSRREAGGEGSVHTT